MVTYILLGIVFVVGACMGLLLLLLNCAESHVQWVPVATPAPVEVELRPPVVPATAAVEKKLGYFPYSAEGGRGSEKLLCAICLDVFEHGEECSKVPACRYMFHQDCIGLWMKSKSSCPLCMRYIVAGSERVSAADDMV